MSLLSKIGGIFKGAIGGFLGGGPIGAVIGGVGGAIGGGGGGGMRPPTTYQGGMGGMRGLPGGGLGGMRTLPGRGTFKIPTIPIRKALPTIGKIAGGAAAAKWAYDAYGNVVQVRRRRRKGITASELKGFKRVACILRDYQKVAVKTHTKAPARRSRTCA
jgi:hypothetical protein